MGLLDEIKAEVVEGGTPLKCDQIMLNMSKADAADLRTALMSPDVRATQIVRALGKRGIKISANAIHNWRQSTKVKKK